MSTHIGAAPGEIAGTVLIAGDPLRARYVAQHMLDNVHVYNEVRGMLGFTGWYQGKRVSIQGTGIGIPSTAIYVHELIHDFDVHRIIRIGTCGALQPDIRLDQLILATSAYTDSATHLLFHPDMDTPAEAPGGLLARARLTAGRMGIHVLEGPVFSTDMFYSEDDNRWKAWQQRGLLAVEMETSILYALAMRNGIEALTILSVSDNIVTSVAQTAADRESANVNLMRLALEMA